MSWSRLPSKESDDTNNRDILRVFRVLVVAAMGCLFGCFRINDGFLPPDSKSHLVSQSIAPKEPVVSRNRSPLSSLFNSEEKGEDDDLHVIEKANQDARTPKSELHTKELRDQAKFLKACGTLPETPAEIRKGLANFKDPSASTRGVEPLKFKSWLSDVVVEKLNLDLLSDHPITPIESNGLEKQSDSLVHTSSSCMMDRQNGQSLPKNSIHGSGSSNTPTSIEFDANQAHRDAASEVSLTFAPSAQYMNKIVRFDCESDLSAVSSKSTSSALDSENSKQAEFSGNYYASKNSPYPTPLKLSDEMQTPGTVFPTYIDNIANGKAARIRSQYVYPVLNPVDRASQLKELSDEESNSRLWSSNMTETGERPNQASGLTELGMSGIKETSDDKDSKVKASLSSWLKSSSINQDEGKQHTSSVYSNNVHYGKTPGDRPILGLVVTHWKDDENYRISPKWWDGNGIPNSTNKYKEDQKVSWYPTPFEERLEKALSQESSIPQRAAIITSKDGTTEVVNNPWRLCAVSQVEEVKCILRLLPIWLCTMLYSVVFTQMASLFVEQGATMKTTLLGFHIPPASMSSFDILSVASFIFIYRRVLDPLIARLKKSSPRGLTELQRMGVGLIIAIMAMVAAGIVEHFRLKSADKDCSHCSNSSSLSIFWQVPQYVLIGASEVFMYVGQLEFFNGQAPDGLKSFGSALCMTSISLGNYVSSLLVSVVMKISTSNKMPGWIPGNLNKGHLDRFYFLLATLTSAAFWSISFVQSGTSTLSLKKEALKSKIKRSRVISECRLKKVLF